MSVIPPNTDDLTLWTDPVTRYALNCFAVSIGAGLVALVTAVWPL